MLCNSPVPAAVIYQSATICTHSRTLNYSHRSATQLRFTPAAGELENCFRCIAYMPSCLQLSHVEAANDASEREISIRQSVYSRAYDVNDKAREKISSSATMNNKYVLYIRVRSYRTDMPLRSDNHYR